MFQLKKCLLLLFISLISLYGSGNPSSGLLVKDLRCLNQINPINIDNKKIYLSWKLKSNERDISQVAYQVVVALSENDLMSNKFVWDSKKVVSSSSIQIEFAGNPPEALQSFFWKVRVWDNNGNVSAWSPLAMWRMALLDANDWKGAKWIAYDTLEN